MLLIYVCDITVAMSTNMVDKGTNKPKGENHEKKVDLYNYEIIEKLF